MSEGKTMNLNERVKEANKLIEAVWKFIVATDPDVYRELVKEREKQ
jgi:hypothetical protein